MTIKSFDSIWEEIHRSNDWGKYPSEEVIRFIARNYYKRDRTITKILDFGCGAGANAWFLAREGFDVYAFDGSKTAVEKTQAYLTKENLKAEIRVSDAVEIDYEDDFFDAIVDVAVIYANKVSDIEKMLKRCYEILKPQGKLYSTGLFAVGMTGYGTGEKIEDNTYRNVEAGSLKGRGTIHFFSKEEILDIWSRAGFKNIKIDEMRRTDMNGAYITNYYMVESEK